MSLLKSNSVQIGQSATATQNFTLSVPASPDGTIKLARGNSGATTQDILSVNASGAVTLTNGGTITLGAVQNSTSGTAIDFTGIPSWVKRITAMLVGVSTNGTSMIQVQIGSGSVETSGYLGCGSYIDNAAASGVTSFTSGFGISAAKIIAATYHGSIVLTLAGSNNWIANGAFARSDAAIPNFVQGSKTTSGVLDRIRITTNSANTFTAGTINIMYEG